jgi:hypothetical protein
MSKKEFFPPRHSVNVKLFLFNNSIVKIVLDVPVVGKRGSFARFPIFGIYCKFTEAAVVGK